MAALARAAAPEPASKEPLRFLTAGSVDDGKSTLIGRLLLDGQALLADQLDALRAGAAAGDALDLSLVTDGLEAEREQGITIDVAFRYFATRARKFIVADAPGHEQYTRNMVTAAAGSDAAVVLVDATRVWRGGAEAAVLLPQTRRHALIAQLLRVPHIVFAVNKLDAVDDAGAAYERIRAAIATFAREARFVPGAIVPISALRGDNVSVRSDFVAGYDGPTLLALLESLDAHAHEAGGEALLPVQFVTSDDARGDGRVRVLWGRVARGRVARGDRLQVLPSGEEATVAELHAAGRVVDGVEAGRSAGVVLDRQLDVSRGDWLRAVGAAQAPSTRFAATIAWLDVEPAVVGRRYWLRHGNRWVQGRIERIESRLDIATLALQAAERLAVNDIGSVVVETQEALPVEPFARDRTAGALVVVDAANNRTSGVLLVAGLPAATA